MLTVPRKKRTWGLITVRGLSIHISFPKQTPLWLPSSIHIIAAPLVRQSTRVTSHRQSYIRKEPPRVQKTDAVSGPALQLCDLGEGRSPSPSRSFLGEGRCSPHEVALEHRCCKVRTAGHASPSWSSRSIPCPGLTPAQLPDAVCAGVLNRLPSAPAFTLLKPSLSTHLEAPRMNSPFQVFVFGKALPDPLKLEIMSLSVALPQHVICAS